MANCPFSLSDSCISPCVVYINNSVRIYIFNSGSVAYYQAEAKTFTDKTVIISEGTKFKTQLYPNNNISGRMLNHIDNAYYYTTDGGLNTNLPRYYGNGTERHRI